MRGSLFPLFPLFWWSMPCHLVKTWATKIGEIGPLNVFPWWSAKSMRGSLFPLFPLRVKCQNHERVPISPIAPILVVHVLTGWIDIGHQNRWNRDPFMVLAFHQGKTLRGSLFPLFPLRVKCQNHERVPIFPLFPLFWWSMSWQDEKIGPENRGNRGNRDPLMVLAVHP